MRTLRRSAEAGLLVFLIAADRGSEVTYRVLDAAGETVRTGAFTATDAAKKLRLNPEEGAYTVAVSAADAVGNTVAVTANQEVAPDPLTAADWVIAGVVVTVTLLLLLILLRWVRRRRHAIRAGLGNIATAGGDLRRSAAHRARVARHARTMAQYQAQVAEYERRERDWSRRRDRLQELALIAREAVGDSVHAARLLVKPKRGERVFGSATGAMLDLRSDQGVRSMQAIDRGLVVVTNGRMVFRGVKNRDWPLANLTSLRHEGADRTLMDVTNRKHSSGVVYDNAEEVRLWIDLAVADLQGGRETVVARADAQLAAHGAARPQPPAAPPPPPEPPVKGRRADAPEAEPVGR